MGLVAIKEVNEEVGVEVSSLYVVEARQPSNQLEEHLLVEVDRRFIIVDDMKIDPSAIVYRRCILDHFFDESRRCNNDTLKLKLQLMTYKVKLKC